MTDFDLGRIIPIDKGEWNDTYSTDAGPGYEKFDIVTSGSGSYLSLVANNTAPLTDRASWFPYVDGASIDALVVALNTADGRVTQVEADIVQLAGDVSLLDAVQGAKIKDIENVLSTANLGQSTQVSVSGVSPLSLPKNAANGGMQVKLEGLTEDVGGVITHFEPTGRVRSVGKNLWKDRLPDVTGRAKYGYGASLISYDDGVYKMENAASVRFNLKLEANVTYVITAKRKWANIIGIGVYDASGTQLGDDTYNGTLKFTTQSADLYVLFFGTTASGYTSFDIYDIQIEKSSVASTYEKRKETSLYLTAPELRSNGTVKDEIRKGSNGYELVKRISDVDGTVLATPVVSPISYGGILNSAESGTVYHEPIIADAGVYGTDIPIFNTDYPIASIEEIIKHEGGVDTYLNASTAVIAPDGLSFTHPDLGSGDLVLFTYAFDKESTNGNITATFYDSNVVKIDTVTGKAYKITDVVTNGVLTRTLTEV